MAAALARCLYRGDVLARAAARRAVTGYPAVAQILPQSAGVTVPDALAGPLCGAMCTSCREKGDRAGAGTPRSVRVDLSSVSGASAPLTPEPLPARGLASIHRVNRDSGGRVDAKGAL
jgi:hypothetical protein